MTNFEKKIFHTVINAEYDAKILGKRVTFIISSMPHSEVVALFIFCSDYRAALKRIIAREDPRIEYPYDRGPIDKETAERLYLKYIHSCIRLY